MEPDPERCILVWGICSKDEECVNPDVMYFGHGRDEYDYKNSRTRTEECPIRMVLGNILHCQWYDTKNHFKSPCGQQGPKCYMKPRYFTCGFCRSKEEQEAWIANAAQENAQPQTEVETGEPLIAPHSGRATPIEMYRASPANQGQSAPPLSSSAPRSRLKEFRKRNPDLHVSVPRVSHRAQIREAEPSIWDPRLWNPNQPAGSSLSLASDSGFDYGPLLQAATIGVDVDAGRTFDSDNNTSAWNTTSPLPEIQPDSPPERSDQKSQKSPSKSPFWKKFKRG